MTSRLLISRQFLLLVVVVISLLSFVSSSSSLSLSLLLSWKTSVLLVTATAATVTATASDTSSSSSSSTTNNNKDDDQNSNCPSYGCPILPLDILYDTNANTALEILRSIENGNDESKTGTSTSTSTSSSNENDREQALKLMKSAGDTNKTTLTLQGDKGGKYQVNQDRAMIYSPYKIGKNMDSNDEIKAQLLGVFDGHGTKGEMTSEHAATNIPKILAEKLESFFQNLNNNNNNQEQQQHEEELVATAIKETFIQVDETDPSNGGGGSTATIVLQIGHKLYIGNAGDSRSFIAAIVEDEVTVVYISREDKPDLPEEKARITKMGGYVHIPNPKVDVPRAYGVAPDGRFLSGVAMSRSIGDRECQGVIAEPIVDVLDVDDIISFVFTEYENKCKEMEKAKKSEQGAKEEEEKKETSTSDSPDDNNNDKDKELEESCDNLDRRNIRVLAVSASDGLMDYLDPEFISFVFAASFFVPDNPHPHTASEYLILQAAGAWNHDNKGQYRDDIVVAAFKVWTTTTTAPDDDTAVKKEKEVGDDAQGQEL